MNAENTGAEGATSTNTVLEERYGRGRKRTFDRRFGWAIGSALVLAMAGFVAFGGWQQGTDLQIKNLSSTVLDERTVQINAQVTAPTDAVTICTLEALSESHATVGWRLLELPAGGQHTRQVTETLVTTGQATTAHVRECWLTKSETR